MLQRRIKRRKETEKKAPFFFPSCQQRSIFSLLFFTGALSCAKREEKPSFGTMSLRRPPSLSEIR